MGFKIEQCSRAELAGFALALLALWGVYLKTLSPAFPANDSPETISASAELGIQHPPGYPLHTLLGRLAIIGFQVGSPAWRANCLSAGLGLCCAMLAAWLCLSLLGRFDFSAALVSLAACGLWRCNWELATEAKGGIYLLNLALCLGMLLALKRSSRIFFLLAGLSLANHAMSALLFILPSAAWLWGRNRKALRHAAWMLPGLSLYLLLPLRAAWEPFNLLRDPRSLKGFLWIVLRKGYTQGELGQDWGVVLDQLRLWCLNTLGFGAFWVAPMGILGFAILWKRSKGDAALLGATYALVFVSVVIVNRTYADVRFLADIFMVPGQAMLAAAAGLAVAFYGKRRALFLLPLLLMHFRALDRSGDFVAYDYGLNVLQGLPRGAYFATEGDYHFMPLVYAQQLQGKRKDVELLVLPLLSEPDYQARLYRRRGIRAQGLQSLASQAPLALSTYHPSVNSGSLWQQGLAQVPSALPVPDMKSAKAWAIRPDSRIEGEPLQRSLLPWYAVALMNAGNQFDALKRPVEAGQAYAMAAGLPGQKPSSHILFNLGQAYYAQGKWAEAEAAWQRSLQWEPGLKASADGLAAIQNRKKKAS